MQVPFATVYSWAKIKSFVQAVCLQDPDKVSEALVGELKVIGKTKDGRNKYLHEFNLDSVAEKAQELVEGVLVKVSSTVNKDDVKKNIQNRFYKNNA